MSRGALVLCLVALLAGVGVGACGGSDGSGSGAGGDSKAASAPKGTATGGDEDGDHTTTGHPGPDGPAFGPPHGDFGPTARGAASKETLEVKNESGDAQTVDGIQIAGANKDDFEITKNDCAVGTELQPGQTCTVEVTFAPGAEGERKASLQVTDKSGAVAKGELQGSGTAPEGQTGTDG